MYTVLNRRMLDAVMVMRAVGQWKIACQVVAGGKRLEAVLGPRVRDCPNSVRVQIGGQVQTVSLGQISVGAEVLAQLQTVIDAQDAAAEKKALRAARADTDLLNELLWRRHQARRTSRGQFAGYSCEPAGRR